MIPFTRHEDKRINYFSTLRKQTVGSPKLISIRLRTEDRFNHAIISVRSMFHRFGVAFILRCLCGALVCNARYFSPSRTFVNFLTQICVTVRSNSQTGRRPEQLRAACRYSQGVHGDVVGLENGRRV